LLFALLRFSDITLEPKTIMCINRAAKQALEAARKDAAAARELVASTEEAANARAARAAAAAEAAQRQAREAKAAAKAANQQVPVKLCSSNAL